MKDIYDLEELLWHRGWVTSTFVGSKKLQDETIDLMAIKDGKSIIAYVIQLESGSSTRRVVDKSNRLSRLRRKASTPRDDYGSDEPGSCNAMFAIWKKDHGHWYSADYTIRNIRYKEDYDKLTEVLR